MRASQDEKAATHERIVGEAARQIRRRGTDQPGVAEIMRAAGLTHGGFYKHFASRDELIADAARQAMAESESLVTAVSAEPDPLAAFVDWYVSAAHRDDPGNGCGVAALGSDAARVEGVRAAYRDQVERYLDVLEGMLDGDQDDRRERAAVILSALVGAVVIARGLGDTPTSNAILDEVRDAVRERSLLAPADPPEADTPRA
jgi:TetR/AcrR family transcriptional regulator, transcriptional repressor for nem operon